MDPKQETLNFSRKHRQGFTFAEIDQLLERFPLADKKYFDNALFGVTCMKVDGEPVFYPVDVLRALRCAVEKRNLYDDEWD